MRLLLPVTVAVLSQGPTSGADQAARGAALQAAIERTACPHLVARRATAALVSPPPASVEQSQSQSSAEECIVRLATAMPLGAHVTLGDLQLGALLPGMRRGADGTYVACSVAERAVARASSRGENAARLTDGAVDSRWESAP